MGSTVRCICQQPARYGVSWLRQGEHFDLHSMQAVFERHSEHGVQANIKGIVWEWRRAQSDMQLVNAEGPKEVEQQRSAGCTTQPFHRSSSVHDEFDSKTDVFEGNRHQPAMEADPLGATQVSPNTESDAKEVKTKKIKNILTLTSKGTHPVLRGGARRPGELAGGSGADVTALWVTTVEDIGRLLRQCAEDFTRIQPMNVGQSAPK